MPSDTLQVSVARPEEREALEAIQWRASLANKADRNSLIANPDSIQLPLEQIENGEVLVAEIDSSTIGFAAVAGNELDGLSWSQRAGAAALGPHLSKPQAKESKIPHCR